jgi:phosphinothricin acetyltransferase
MIEPFASPTTRVAGVVARPAVAHHAHMALRIDPMTADDAAAVIRIYAEGIATRNASLERVAPDWAHFDRSHRDDCRFVARDDAAGDVLGWTALGNYSPRAVYRGVAWESVYVGAEARGLGVGRALLETLIPASEAVGIWTLLAGVLADNTASLALHERVGFRQVGVQRGMGQDAAGRWRDVLLLERRSRTVGVPDSTEVPIASD